MDLKTARTWLSGTRGLYIIWFLFLIGYVILMVKLNSSGLLPESALAGNITQFVAWILALVLAAIHLKISRENDFEGGREETKRSLEIEAFRGINEGISAFSSLARSIKSPFDSLRSYISISPPTEFSRKRAQEVFSSEIIAPGPNLWDALTKLTLAIESHEIAVVKHRYLVNYLFPQIEKTSDLIWRLKLDLPSMISRWLQDPEVGTEIIQRCGEASDKLLILEGYAFDLRIHLMNELLGDVFGEKVPQREPTDPKFARLTDVATPELVARMDEQWIRRVVGQDDAD